MTDDELLAAIMRKLIRQDASATGGDEYHYGGYAAFGLNGSPHFVGDGNGWLTLDLTIVLTGDEVKVLQSIEPEP